MKKKILGLALLASTMMLTSCMDPEQNSNDAVLQNALSQVSITEILGVATGDGVGINQLSIPGFENATGDSPTQVTVTASNVPLVCGIINSGLQGFVGSSTSTSAALSSQAGVDSFLIGMVCGEVGVSANVTISFTAGGKDYTATTTLTSQ